MRTTTRMTVLAAICGLTSSGFGITLTVPGSASTIQGAIDMAQDGDFIFVTPGTYTERINLKGKAITLRGTAGAEDTIIHGGWDGTTITCNTGEGPDTRIEGFTISGGTGTTVNGHIRGGGMYNKFSSPTVLDCRFSGNILSAWAFNSKGAGAGMFNESAHPTVRGCVFEGNELLGCSGWLNGGAAIFNDASSPMIIECVMRNGFANNGGGLMNANGSHPQVYNTVIADNEATFSGGGVNCTEDSSAMLVNCVVSGNAAYHGGGLYTTGSTMSVVNCTVAHNHATRLGAGAYFMSSSSAPDVRNSIFWGNTADEVPAEQEVAKYGGNGPQVTHSIVAGGYAGAGNLASDPRFVSATGSDYRLRSDSPGLDSGNGDAMPQDGGDLDYDGNTSETVPMDLDRTPRITGGTPDRGAFESATSSACPCDLTQDGDVGFPDLLVVLNFWDGLCDWCSDDIDGTGAFGLGDLLAVLSNWGPCS